ncbi:cytochrome b/b6 domain-containing protein [Alteromonas genovensis]|uniref:cytochrome b/b6 domain-containing protein n=1 Tax=Alteromonas genovensis TaxID=471225 RepID=UPI002FE2B9A7
MKKRLIWDLPTRLFHWLLVLSILAQYVTAELLDDAVQWHFYIGYFTLGLIIFRLLWGIFGPRYAKFSQFVKGPGAVFAYAKTLFDRDSLPSVGHNPLGGWFVVVMIALVLVQAVSGLFMTDDIFLDGPLRSMAKDDVLSIMNTLHHLSFDTLVYIIALHIGASVFYGFYKRQKLVPPMISGKKPLPEDEAQYYGKAQGITHSELGKAIIIALVAAACVYVVVEVLPPSAPAAQYYY